MNAWLRLTLILVTVGGGFYGMVAVFQAFEGYYDAGGTNLLFWICMLGAYSFITAAGLIFAHEPQSVPLLRAALAMQIPWVSSSLVFYHLSAGFSFFLYFGHPGDTEGSGATFWYQANLGARCSLAVFQQHPWTVGVNVVPVVLLILLIRSGRTRPRMTEVAPQVPSDPIRRRSEETVPPPPQPRDAGKVGVL